MAHQTATTGIGGDGMVACDQGVGCLRRAFVAAIAPFAPGLADQRIDDVERGVEDAPQVGQHVGHPHEVVIVGARVALRLTWHQPKEILERQGDAHKGVVLDLADGDKLIDIDCAFGQKILAEHLATAGDTDRAIGGLGAIDMGDVELAQDGQHGSCHPRVGAFIHGIEADIGVDDLGGGAFAQEGAARHVRPWR